MEDQRLQIVVPLRKKKERLDAFLAREIKQISRSRIQKLIEDDRVTVDGRIVKARYSVHPGETIDIVLPRPAKSQLTPENIPLDIVYEDEYLLVVNKQPGMVVHPAYGHATGTLVHALLHHSNLVSEKTPERPGIVHRLDKDTSGLLVVAKNDTIHQQLSDQFARKTTDRLYVAVVWGHFARESDTIESFLGRSRKDRRKVAVAREGKHAVTHFQVKEVLPLTSLLEVRLETGRTHQIRVHMAHSGHPVFGDQTYGGRGARLGGLNLSQTALAVSLLEEMPRQALHAGTLGFRHPVSGKTMKFSSSLPPDMETLINQLRRARAGTDL